MSVHWVQVVCRIAVVSCCAAVSTYQPPIGAKQTPDKAWKHYRNARWGFCLDYPASWKPRFGTDGSGIDLVPQRGSGELGIGGLPDQPQGLYDSSTTSEDLNHAPPMTLEQNFAEEISALKEYGHASDVLVLKKHALTFQGNPALDTTRKYRIRPSQTVWVERTLLVNKENVIFTVDLTAPSAEFQPLETVFEDIIAHRLKFTCPTHP